MEGAYVLSSNVDNRVVNMKFNNGEFEKNVSTSLSSIEKLKEGLKFEGVQQSASTINNSLKGITLNFLGEAVDAVGEKFSAMGTVATTALTNITNSVINAGKALVNEIAIEPITQGFSEYELKMGSVQNIMNGAHASLEDVNGVLDELNTYADRTIYSFSDMTSNIGKFTNAGVKLEDAVAAIKGISNEAALSGANANEASRAMYNFAQALSSGSVKYIDWTSIKTANMATMDFKQVLIDTATELGTLVQEGDAYVSTTTDMQGKVSKAFNALENFDESLSSQWMTTEVLVKALGKYTDETTELGKAAYDAATKVKTFNQLKDTMGEAVGSGWATTYEMIFGNFEEATELWTWFNDTIGGIINDTSEARNSLLQMWKEAGGRATLVEALKNGVQGILNIIDSIKMGIRDVIPPMTANKLISITRDISGAMFRFSENEALFSNIRSIVSGIVSTLQVGFKVIKAVIKFLWPILKTLVSILFKIWGFVSDIITFINGILVETGIFTKVMGGLTYAFELLSSGVKWLIDIVKGFFAQIKPERVDDFSTAIEDTSEPVKTAADTIEKATTRVEKFREAFNKIVQWFKDNQYIRATYDFIKTFFVNIVSAVASFISGLRKQGEDLRNNNIFTLIGDGIKSAWEKGKGFFTELGPNLSNFGTFLGQFLNKAWDALVIAKDALLKFFGADSIFDMLKKILELFTQFKFGKFMGGLGEALEGAGKVGEIAEAFGNVTTGITKALTKYIKKKPGKFIQAIKAIGMMFVEIAAAILIIASIETEKAKDAAKIVGTLVTVTIVLITAMSWLMKNTGQFSESTTIGSIAGLIYAIGGFIVLMASAVKTIAKISEKYGSDSVDAALDAVFLLSSVLTGSAILITRFAKVGDELKGTSDVISIIKQVSKAIRSMAMIVAILALPIFKEDNLKLALNIVTVLSVLLAGFTQLPRIIKKDDKYIYILMGKMFKSIGSALVEMGAIVAILSLLNPQKAVNATIIVGMLSIILAGLAAMSKVIDGRKAKELGIAMTIMGAAIAIIASTVKKLGKMKLEDAAQGLLAIVSIIAILGVATVVLAPISAALTAVSVAMLLFGVGVLAFGEGILSLVKAVKQLKNIGAGIDTFIAFMDAVAVKIPEWISKFITSIITTLFSMVGTIADALVQLIMKVIESLAGSAETIVTAILRVIQTFIAKLGEMSKSIDIDYGGMVQILLMIGLIGAIMYAVMKIGDNIKTAIVGVASIILVLAAVVGAVIAIDKVGNDGGNRIDILAGLAGTILALAGTFAAIALMSKVASKPGGVKGMFIAIGGFLALILGMVGVISLIGAIASWIGADDSEAALNTAVMVMNKVGEALGAFVGGFGATIVEAMSGVENMIPALAVMGLLIPAVAVITPLLPVMVAFIAGIGGLMELLDEWFREGSSEKFIDMIKNAKGVMEGVGEAIGAFIGGFAGGIMESINDAFINSIVSFGTGLSKFAEEIKPFIESIKMVDSDTIDSALKLAGLIIAFTAAEIINGVASWFLGSVDLSSFGEQLAKFAPYMVTYSNLLTEGNFNADLVNKSAVAALLLGAFANNLPHSGGVARWFTGNPPKLGEFGNQLIDFGEGLLSYGAKIETMTDSQWEAIDRSMPSLLSIIETVSKIPNSGGVAGFFAGENDADKFGDMLPALGLGISGYATNIGELTDGDIKAINKSLTSVESIIKLAEMIPNSGGVAEFFSGKNDIDKFAEKLPSLGENLYNYAVKIKDMPNGWRGNIDAATGAMRGILSLGESITGTGGLTSFFYKEKDLGDLGPMLTELGKGLYDFSNSSKDIDTPHLKLTAWALIELINSLKHADELDYDAMDAFKDGIQGIALSSIDNLATAFIEGIPKVVGAAQDYFSAIESGINAKSNDIRKAIKDRMSDVVSGIFDGFKEKKEDIDKGMDKITTAMVDRINDYSDDDKPFFNASKNCINGLIRGVTSMIEDAQNAGSIIGDSFYFGFAKRLKIQSPSKVMDEEGAYNAVRGLVLGIKKRLKDAQNAGEMLGTSTFEGTKSTFKHLADVVNDELDISPVISPIVDLSDVSEGARTIGGMLSMRTSFGLSAGNASIINANRESIERKQNTVKDNDDIIKTMGDIMSMMENLGEAIINRPVELDGERVSKQIATPLDKEFGRRLMYSRRGN